jgi:hypothetical protein
LVELLLAIFVLVVAGTGILGTYLAAHTLSEYARQTSTALDDLKDIMERIHATPYLFLEDDFPDGVDDGGLDNDYAAIVGGYTLEDETITVSYPVVTADQIEIVATLTWVQQGRDRSVSLSTIRSSS